MTRFLNVLRLSVAGTLLAAGANAACNLEPLNLQVANGSKNPDLRNQSGCILNYGLAAGGTVSVTLSDITSPSVAKHAFLTYKAVSLTLPGIYVVADITPTKFGTSPTAGDISSTGNGWRLRPGYLDVASSVSKAIPNIIKLYNEVGAQSAVSVSIELYR